MECCNRLNTAEDQWTQNKICVKLAYEPTQIAEWNRSKNCFKPLANWWQIFWDIWHLIIKSTSTFLGRLVILDGHFREKWIIYRKIKLHGTKIKQLAQNHPKMVASQIQLERCILLKKELLWKLFPETGGEKLMKADASTHQFIYLNWRSDEKHGKVVKSVEKEAKLVEI